MLKKIFEWAVTPSLNFMSLTNATGRTALRLPPLFPDVDWLRVGVHSGVRGYLVRIGILPDDVMVGDVALMDLFTWVE